MDASAGTRAVRVLIGAGTLVTVVWWALRLPLMLDMFQTGEIAPWSLPPAVASLLILVVGVVRFWLGSKASAAFVFYLVLSLITVRSLALSTPAFAGPFLLGIGVAVLGLGRPFFARKKLRPAA